MNDSQGAYIVACGTMLKGETNPEYAKRAAGPAEESGLSLIAGGLVGHKVEVLVRSYPLFFSHYFNLPFIIDELRTVLGDKKRHLLKIERYSQFLVRYRFH